MLLTYNYISECNTNITWPSVFLAENGEPTGMLHNNRQCICTQLDTKYVCPEISGTSEYLKQQLLKEM